MEAVVTKKSVKTAMPKLFNVVFNLVLKEGTDILLEQDFSIAYRTGENVGDKVAKVKEDMQKAINDYKAEQAIFTSSALNSAVTSINGGLVI